MSINKVINMEYPKYLSIGNYLFKHLEVDALGESSVGGPSPRNLYHAVFPWRSINLSTDIKTYECLIEYGCTEPDKKEILRLLRI